MVRSRRVVFVTPVIHHYRGKFHQLMREHLSAAGVSYEVICGVPTEAEMGKGDLIEPPWTKKVSQKKFRIGGAALSYHPILTQIRTADMVIIMQENKHLQNYLLQILPRKIRPILGMMGHGRNFQSRKPRSYAEKWKRFWAVRVDWWFGYTDETRNHLEALGYPAHKITIFNNSVDTSELRQQLSNLADDRVADLRSKMNLDGKMVGIFVGGVYPDKRMAFLVDAADHVRQEVPNFELIIVGGGPDLPLVQHLALSRPWLHVTGPKFGQEKAELLSLGHVFMMPGLMGLAILDAGVAGLPVATTAFPWHSPEIAYLNPGVNGLKTENWDDHIQYGQAVADLLNDHEQRRSMSQQVREMANKFSVEAMAKNFSDGILRALSQ